MKYIQKAYIKSILKSLDQHLVFKKECIKYNDFVELKVIERILDGINFELNDYIKRKNINRDEVLKLM